MGINTLRNLKEMRIGFCAMIADTTALFTTMKQKQLPHFAKALSDGTLMRKVGEVNDTDSKAVSDRLRLAMRCVRNCHIRLR